MWGPASNVGASALGRSPYRHPDKMWPASYLPAGGSRPLRLQSRQLAAKRRCLLLCAQLLLFRLGCPPLSLLQVSGGGTRVRSCMDVRSRCMGAQRVLAFKVHNMMRCKSLTALCPRWPPHTFRGRQQSEHCLHGYRACQSKCVE